MLRFALLATVALALFVTHILSMDNSDAEWEEEEEDDSDMDSSRKVEELRGELESVIEQLSPEAKELVNRAFEYMKEQKTYGEIEREIDSLIDNAPADVRDELETFENQADNTLARLTNYEESQDDFQTLEDNAVFDA